MVDPVWPIGLPEYVLVDGYQEHFPDNVIETAMDQGTTKIRRRGSASFRQFQVVHRMDEAQVEQFYAFYVTTLLHGTLTFTWKHPRSGTPATLRFRKPAPTLSAISHDCYDVTMKLEIMPA